MILPEDFKEIFIKSHGKEAFDKFNASLTLSEQVTSVRFNPNKISCDDFMIHIERVSGGKVERVPWCTTGFYLNRRPSFTHDPLFHTGAYYVQDASSMFLESAFNAIRRVEPSLFEAGRRIRVLDMCAAPGGKSTHLLQLIGSSGIVVSNEVIGSRASILRENIEIWGAANSVVTSSDSEKFADNLPGWFDIVLVDAPCSGEGMFRKMESSEGNAAIENWSIDNVRLCAARQQRIVSAAVKCLKAGGFLIYSTCTFNHCENDDIISFLKEEFAATSIDMDFDLCHSSISKNILRTAAGGWQFIPGLVTGEGQFCALMRIEGCGTNNFTVKKKTEVKRQQKLPEQISSILVSINNIGTASYTCSMQGELYKAVPKSDASDAELLAKSVKVLSCGVAIGYIKGKDLVPEHSLATAAFLSPENCADSIGLPFNRFEVSEDIALEFLSKEPIILNGAPRGLLLLTYMGKGLGFVKNLGNRCNSLLPSSRRILQKRQ